MLACAKFINLVIALKHTTVIFCLCVKNEYVSASQLCNTKASNLQKTEQSFNKRKSKSNVQNTYAEHAH